MVKSFLVISAEEFLTELKLSFPSLPEPYYKLYIDLTKDYPELPENLLNLFFRRKYHEIYDYIKIWAFIYELISSEMLLKYVNDKKIETHQKKDNINDDVDKLNQMLALSTESEVFNRKYKYGINKKIEVKDALVINSTVKCVNKMMLETDIKINWKYSVRKRQDR